MCARFAAGAMPGSVACRFCAWTSAASRWRRLRFSRVLRPGGLVYHEIPFIQGFHASPGDFRRFTLVGIRELAPGNEVLEAGVAVGPSSAMLWVASEWLALLFSCGRETLFKVGRRVFAWLLGPIKLADAWLERHPHAPIVASAFYLMARKPKT